MAWVLMPFSSFLRISVIIAKKMKAEGIFMIFTSSPEPSFCVVPLARKPRRDCVAETVGSYVAQRRNC